MRRLFWHHRNTGSSWDSDGRSRREENYTSARKPVPLDISYCPLCNGMFPKGSLHVCPQHKE